MSRREAPSPRRSRVRRALGTGALLLVTAFSGVARAQSDVTSKAAAEGLFDQGRELMKKGDFNKSCTYLERSQQLDPAVGTLLYLAECYERGGRSASAWTTFREAADAARASGQVERQRLAQERAARIAPNLSRLIIEVPEAVRAIPGLIIRRQGEPLPPAAWDVPVPIDPGDYRVEASAPGYERFSGTVQVAGAAATAHFAIPALKSVETAAAPPPAPTPLEARKEPAPPPPAPALDTASGPNAQRLTAYFVGGAGVIGLGLGTFFGLRAIKKNDEAEDFCPRSPQCDDPQGVNLTSEAKTAATLANISFAVGGAALAGGLVLFLTAPDSKEESPRLNARVTPSGVWLNGAF